MQTSPATPFAALRVPNLRVSSFAGLKALLAARGVPFGLHPTEQTLWLASPLADGRIFLRWVDGLEMVQVYQPMLSEIPARALPELALTLARVNTGLRVLGFTLDLDRGELGFRTHALLDERGSVPLTQLADLLFTAVDTAGSYQMALSEVVWPSEREIGASEPAWWDDLHGFLAAA